jgi:predicted DNA-binding protein with PD1-like motif
MEAKDLLIDVGSCRLERVVQFRVKEGSDLIVAIKEGVLKENIDSGIIVSGIGALKRAIFRNLKVFPDVFPVQKKDRIYLEVTSPMELVSLGGWIAAEKGGEPNIHAHFSASTVVENSVVTMGGHLTEGTIAGIKVVVAIAVLERGSATAAFDEATQSNDIFFNMNPF